MRGLRSALGGLFKDNTGLDLLEYALGMVLIAGAAVAGVTSVVLKISQAFALIAAKLTTYTS